MDDQTLLKLSLIVSLTGILFLILISERIEIERFNISDLTIEDLDKDVKINGRIVKVTETPGLIILDLNDGTGKITGIIFKEEPINLTTGQQIEVQGRIVEYKGKLEININQLRSLV